MIKLPVHKLDELIKSLEGEVISIVSELFLYKHSQGMPHPFIVCVTKVNPLNESDDLYYVYLIDVLRFHVVGNPCKVHIEPRFNHSSKEYYLLSGNHNGQVNYMSSTKWGGVGDDLYIGYIGMPKYLDGILGLNDNYQCYESGPYVKRNVSLKNIVWNACLLDSVDGARTHYKSWVMDYLGKLELLQDLNKTFEPSSCLSLFSNNKQYLPDLRAVEERILRDLDNMWLTYPNKENR